MANDGARVDLDLVEKLRFLGAPAGFRQGTASMARGSCGLRLGNCNGRSGGCGNAGGMEFANTAGGMDCTKLAIFVSNISWLQWLGVATIWHGDCLVLRFSFLSTAKAKGLKA